MTPSARDWSFTSSIVRALTQAGAALVLGTARYWDKDGKDPAPAIAAAIILALLVIYEPWRDRRKKKKERLGARQREQVLAALGRLVAEVQAASRAPVDTITAHVHLLGKKRFRSSELERSLERLGRLVFNDNYGPTDIAFTLSKGVIGKCCQDKQSTVAELVKTRVVKATTSDDWAAITDDEAKYNLTWAEQRQLENRRYGGIVAEPIRDGKGKVVGVVSLGVAVGLEANLRTGRVNKAMGVAAVDVSRALEWA